VPLQEVSFGMNLLGLNADAKWVPSEDERTAAWEFLVELVTRTSVAPLQDDEGSLRAAMDSLYDLFAITRVVLTRNGPRVAKDKRDGTPSLGTVAATILNSVLRPVLSKWHPLLDDREALRPPDKGPTAWERDWDHAGELRAELTRVREMVSEYLSWLGRVAEATEFASAARPPKGRDE
jgi:hypothetical protein